MICINAFSEEIYKNERKHKIIFFVMQILVPSLFALFYLKQRTDYSGIFWISEIAVGAVYIGLYILKDVIPHEFSTSLLKKRKIRLYLSEKKALTAFIVLSTMKLMYLRDVVENNWDDVLSVEHVTFLSVLCYCLIYVLMMAIGTMINNKTSIKFDKIK